MTATRLQHSSLLGRCAGVAVTALAAGAALLMAGAVPAAAAEFFRSDAYGTRLAPLVGGPAAHAGYVLAVDTPDEAQADGLVARRRLLHGGTEVTEVSEWRRTAAGDGSVEHEAQAGRVVGERRYDVAGRLLEESRFGAAGELLQRAVLTYRGGALRRVHRYDGAGELTAIEEFELTSSGRLRGFSHTPASQEATSGSTATADPVDGSEPEANAGTAPTGAVAEAVATTGTLVVFFRFHNGELIEERRRRGDAEVMLRFRDGEQFAAEQWLGEQLVIERSAGVRVDHAGATRTETTVDGAGRVQTERVWEIAAGEGAALPLEERNYRYRDDGTVLSLQVVGQAGVETVDYEFGDDGRLIREQMRRRGRLLRVITYPSPAERVEEVHADGNTVLRVIWRDDRPIREELLSDGEVVRSRDLSPDAAPGDASASTS